MIAWHQAWGEDRVCFHDEQGRLRAIPATWTSIVEPDPFLTLAAGRSVFRVADLLRLADLLRGLTCDDGERSRTAGCKGNCAGVVKT